MAKGNSARRNSAFDLTKPEFIRPQTRLEANRWLDKVTFGAATALTDIDASTKTNIVSIGTDEAVQLMGSTYATYLDAAFSADPRFSPTEGITTALSTNYLLGNEEFGADTTYAATGGVVDYEGFQRWMITEGIYGPARVRIKALYALSQMVVCRRSGANMRDMTAFVGAMFDATKSTNSNTFLTLLKKVTYNLAMGKWLTYENNAKADVATGARPDENYAREIMQLFSIGLDCLNLDGTPVRDVDGNVVPTYSAAYVSEAAKFFTGFGTTGGGTVVSYTDHMLTDGRVHEIASKAAIAYPDGTQNILPAQTLFRMSVDTFSNPNGYVVTRIDANTFSVQASEIVGFGYLHSNYLGSSLGYWKADGVIQVSTSSARVAGSATVEVIKANHGLVNGDVIYSKSNVESSIDYFLQKLTEHPTCAPYVAKSLIKLLVTNNPSPQYVRRVAQKFNDNGAGVRGDLSSVFKAIFLDRECIIPYGKNTNNHGRYLTLFDRFMKLANNLRNDCVHLHINTASDFVATQGLPAWGSPTGAISAVSQAIRVYFTEPRIKREYTSTTPDRILMNPYPFNSASVFNFYRPGYVPPKTRLGELGLTAPELQITTAESQSIWTNMVLSAVNYHDLSYGASETTIPAGGDSGEVIDPRGGTSRNSGLNFSSGATITVTADGVPNNIANGYTEFTGTISNLEHAIPAIANAWWSYAYHRRLGGYVRLLHSRPNAAGEAAGIVFRTNGLNLLDKPNNVNRANASYAGLFVTGDVLDVGEFFVTGASGFPGKCRGSGQQPYVTLLHKAATSLPDTATVTDAELDAGIAYLEGILMTSPISPQLRQKMKDAANLAVTLPTRAIPASDTPFLNHYRYMVYGYSQIRIRRMMGVLLVSPEFCTQY